MPVFNLVTCALIIAYKANRKTNHKITRLNSVKKQTINLIYTRVIKRGFDPALRPIKIENKHVKDASQSRRPSKQQEAFKKVVSLVRRD